MTLQWFKFCSTYITIHYITIHYIAMYIINLVAVYINKCHVVMQIATYRTAQYFGGKKDLANYSMLIFPSFWANFYSFYGNACCPSILGGFFVCCYLNLKLCCVASCFKYDNNLNNFPLQLASYIVYPQLLYIASSVANITIGVLYNYSKLMITSRPDVVVVPFFCDSLIIR